MAILTSSSIFDISAAPQVYTESLDLPLYPQNAGAAAFRELHYPNNLYPPLVYESNPDKWENFDAVPWTDRPQVAAELTLAGVQIANWLGYVPDRPVKEYWLGSDTEARVTAYFVRRLFEMFKNPPAAGYITWWPKDRTAQGYNIILETIQVGGSDLISFHALALREAEVIPYEVLLQFRIISEVAV